MNDTMQVTTIMMVVMLKVNMGYKKVKSIKSKVKMDV
jgi:hypothetical protein